MDDFHCLRVAFSSSNDVISTHTIYCKIHRVRMNSELTPNDRTLFSLGWPPYSSKTLIKELFSRAGHVAEVFLQASPGSVEGSRVIASLTQGHPRGFQVAYIVMSSVDEACAAIKLCEAETALPCSLNSTDVGLKKWCTDYARERINIASLEGDAVDVVSSYDRQQYKEKRREKRRSQPDEDGWITITRKRKATQYQDGKAPLKKKKKKELVNLYPWQQRETQRQQVAELRQKFEEDKRRVEEMKARRKFKPF